MCVLAMSRVGSLIYDYVMVHCIDKFVPCVCMNLPTGENFTHTHTHYTPKVHTGNNMWTIKGEGRGKGMEGGTRRCRGRDGGRDELGVKGSRVREGWEGGRK